MGLFLGVPVSVMLSRSRGRRFVITSMDLYLFTHEHTMQMKSNIKKYKEGVLNASYFFVYYIIIMRITFISFFSVPCMFGVSTSLCHWPSAEFLSRIGNRLCSVSTKSMHSIF